MCQKYFYDFFVFKYKNIFPNYVSNNIDIICNKYLAKQASSHLLYKTKELQSFYLKEKLNDFEITIAESESKNFQEVSRSRTNKR